MKLLPEDASARTVLGAVLGAAACAGLVAGVVRGVVSGLASAFMAVCLLWGTVLLTDYRGAASLGPEIFGPTSGDRGEGQKRVAGGCLLLIGGAILVGAVVAWVHGR